MNSSKYLVDVNIADVEKRYKPSKHYVYCIWTTWSDGSKQLIFRRYSQFFELQCKLLDSFLVEAGHYSPLERTIPFLPGKIIFGRSHIKSVALDRLHPINQYCKKLIQMKNEISRCNLVLSFFQINNNDIAQSTKHDLDKKEKDKLKPEIQNEISKPIKMDEYICIYDYKALSKTELSLKKNMKVFVVEKNLNGWWFVDSNEGLGYVPQCVLKPLDPSKDEKNSQPVIVDNPETHIVTKDYLARKSDEISIKKGNYVSVIEKNLTGWWRIKFNNQEGLVPAVYLQPFTNGQIHNMFDSRSNSWDSFNSSNNYSQINEDYNPPRADFFNENDNLSITPSQINTQSYHATETHVYENSNQFYNDSFSYSNPVNETNFEENDIYYVVENYIDTFGDGVTLTKEEEVTVLSKENTSGWWYVRLKNNSEGWAPSSYLQKEKPKSIKPKPPPRPKPPKSTEIIKTLNQIYNPVSYENNQNNSKEAIFQKTTLNSHENKIDPNNNDINNLYSQVMQKKQPNENGNDYKPVKVSEMRKRFEGR